MYSIIQFASIPLLGSMGGAGAEWPTLGAVFVWTILAALVGSGLGILRDGSRARREVAHQVDSSREAILPPLHADHAHPEAA
jgi:hypothetical protein